MTLKQLTWRLILPLTIISFGTVTKWWYVLPVDAPDTMMIGFPLVFVGDGWFTSMSLQIFLFEFIIDFLSYLLFWVFIVFLIKHYFKKINLPKGLIRAVWTLTVLIVSYWVLIFSISEKRIEVKRDWDRQVFETGFKFTWTNEDRPDLSKFYPNKK